MVGDRDNFSLKSLIYAEKSFKSNYLCEPITFLRFLRETCGRIAIRPALAAEAALWVWGGVKKHEGASNELMHLRDELLTELEEDYFSQKSSSVPVMMLL